MLPLLLTLLQSAPAEAAPEVPIQEPATAATPESAAPIQTDALAESEQGTATASDEAEADVAPLEVPEPSELLPASEYQSREEASGAAIEAIRQGQYQRAHEILGQVVVLEHWERANEQFDAGDPGAALVWVDRALDIAPRDAALRQRRAEGLLALADQQLNAGGPGGFVLGAYEDALRAFKQLPKSAATLLGASRSAYMLNRATEAHELAREARQRMLEFKEPGPTFASAAEISANSTYLAFAEAAQAVADADPGADIEISDALYQETLTELGGLIADRPEVASTWTLGANLEVYQGTAKGDPSYNDRALAHLRRGLEFLPDDPVLLQRLTAIANNAGGAARAAAELKNVAAVAPDLPRTQFELAKQQFFAGVASFPEGASAPDDAYAETKATFQAAEAGFTRAIELSNGGDSISNEGPGWAVISRAGQGWSDYWAGELESAQAEFMATRDMLPGGLEWNYEGMISSSLVGLQNVLGKYRELGNLEAAAQLSDALFEIDPNSANFANNAGFFNRDAAVERERWGRLFCAAAAGTLGDDSQLIGTASLDEILGELRRRGDIAPEIYGTQAEKRIFRERAAALFDAARTQAATSAAAYERAAELAPTDVRVVNDTGLVYVYYTHDNLERAEELLREAVRLGEAELATTTLEGQELLNLQEAFGDAHENLGVLYLEFKEDPEAARRFFERAVEIGPYPRQIVTSYYLPSINGETDLAFEQQVRDWAQPCQ